MKIFDSHTHVNFQPFKKDYREVLQRALANDILVNNVGSQWESSQRSVEIAEEFEYGVWATIGLHPIHVFENVTEEQEIEGNIQKIKTRAEDFDYDRYKKLAQSSNKVVAIGECGLDYYHFERDNLRDKRHELIELQKKALKQQIELAMELDLAVVIHCRDAAVHSNETTAAFDDLYDLLKEYNGSVRGVVHCYTGTPRYIPKFLELGLYIGFTGIISFPNAKDVQESLKIVPDHRIVLETDAPYLTPVPHRGKRNEPSFVRFVAEAAAELKGVKVEQMIEQTTANAFELFKIN